MAGPEVCVIGGVMFDYHYSVSNLPEPDGGAFAPEVEVALGGVGGNVAVALDRLGRDVALVSRLGADAEGDRVRDRLRETSIDLTHVQQGETPSTYSMIFRDSRGERMIITANRGYAGLTLDEDDIEYLASADAVFVTAYTPDRVVSRVLDHAEEPDFPPVAFDLSGPVSELVGRGTAPETIAHALEYSALFVSGRVGATSFFPGDLDDAAAALSAADVPRAALTRGAAGASLFAGAEWVDIQAFDVDPVDTTGAGDAFVGALIDRWLLDGATAAHAGRFAAAAAAINCRERFAQRGLPTREQVDKFLQERED